MIPTSNHPTSVQVLLKSACLNEYFGALETCPVTLLFRFVMLTWVSIWASYPYPQIAGAKMKKPGQFTKKLLPLPSYLGFTTISTITSTGAVVVAWLYGYTTSPTLLLFLSAATMAATYRLLSGCISLPDDTPIFTGSLSGTTGCIICSSRLVMCSA